MRSDTYTDTALRVERYLEEDREPPKDRIIPQHRCERCEKPTTASYCIPCQAIEDKLQADLDWMAQPEVDAMRTEWEREMRFSHE